MRSLRLEALEDRCLLSAGGLGERFLSEADGLQPERTAGWQSEAYWTGTFAELPSGPLEVSILNSPATPPMSTASSIVTSLSASAVMLSEVPTSTWTYGCSATSAGMLFGYYDRHGYPNMYTGPCNGGVVPLTNLGQGDDPAHPIPGACSIIATQNGFDGRTTQGHVNDYWISYNTQGPDPWEAQGSEHTWGECTADYMGTNQWKWDFLDGDGIKDFVIDGGTALFQHDGRFRSRPGHL